MTNSNLLSANEQTNIDILKKKDCAPLLDFIYLIYLMKMGWGD
jgi:hypothetical protein